MSISIWKIELTNGISKEDSLKKLKKILKDFSDKFDKSELYYMPLQDNKYENGLITVEVKDSNTIIIERKLSLHFKGYVNVLWSMLCKELDGCEVHIMNGYKDYREDLVGTVKLCSENRVDYSDLLPTLEFGQMPYSDQAEKDGLSL